MANIGYEPGAMEEYKVILKNADGSKSIDITYLTVEMSITEDIFKNTMYGSVKIKDSIDLLGGAPSSNRKDLFQILGEEFIEVSYKIKDSEHISLRFFVYKISDIVYHQNNTKKEYILHFCSEEHLIDATSVVMKSYKSSHDKNIESILKEYLKIDDNSNGKKPKKISKLQPTKGIQSVIIPRLPPLQACQFLARRSIAEQTFDSGTYLFFENMDGFNFCDVEYLIKVGREKIKKSNNDNNNSPFEYFYGQPNVQDPKKQDIKKQFKTLLKIDHVSYFDTIEKLKMGMFESEILVYDFANHSALPTRFKFLNNEDKTNSTTMALGNESGKSYPENSITFIQNVTSKTDVDTKFSRKFFIVKDKSFTATDTFLDQIIPARAAYFTRLAQNMFTINTYGDPMIKAGDVVILNIPQGDGNNISQINKYISGEYLVCTINHMFTQTTYLTKMDVYKNSFGSQVNTTIEAGQTKITPADNNAKSNDYDTEQSFVGYEENTKSLYEQELEEQISPSLSFFKNLIGL